MLSCKLGTWRNDAPCLVPVGSVRAGTVPYLGPPSSAHHSQDSEYPENSVKTWPLLFGTVTGAGACHVESHSCPPRHSDLITRGRHSLAGAVIACDSNPTRPTSTPSTPGTRSVPSGSRSRARDRYHRVRRRSSRRSPSWRTDPRATSRIGHSWQPAQNSILTVQGGLVRGLAVGQATISGRLQQPSQYERSHRRSCWHVPAHWFCQRSRCSERARRQCARRSRLAGRGGGLSVADGERRRVPYLWGRG